jgi:hypothetical protein
LAELIAFIFFRYGDYQNYAEQPEFSSYYPAVGQKSFFPISRSTNGLAFATALEEFPDLLDDNLTEALSNSIKINLASNYTPTLGFEQTSYALMTAVLACYGGQKFSIEYALDQGNLLADQIISNYDLYNTIPEFNSPDFLSFVIWPLAFAAKHLGNTTDSVPLNIGERAQGMISGIWNQTSQFYHAQLRNLAGPWERVFGFDMTRTHTTLSSYIWAMFGQEHSPAYRATPVNPLYKVTDIANDAFICIYFDYQNAFISDDVRAAFNTFPGDHSVQTAAYLPSVDGSPRLISAWLGANISIGTESINETALGGPFPVESTYVPAAIQWSTGGLGGTEIGAIILAQTETQMDITVQPHLLNISYPAANESSTFEFHVLSFYDGRTVGSWYDLRGLEVDVTTNMANSNYTVGFAGGSGGSGGSPVDGYEFWNFTYSLPQGYSSDDNGPAWIALEPYVDGSLQAS